MHQSNCVLQSVIDILICHLAYEYLHLHRNFNNHLKDQNNDFNNGLIMLNSRTCVCLPVCLGKMHRKKKTPWIVWERVKLLSINENQNLQLTIVTKILRFHNFAIRERTKVRSQDFTQ